MDKDFLFADDIIVDNDPIQTARWRILIVDDEPDVHRITRLVLSGFQFDGQRLEFLSAYSGDEACQIMAQEQDIAMVLLDVIMETDRAGLDVARFIREELRNPYTRIVLRTGQAGQVPEHDIMRSYDINDYKDKTELTTTKLNTLLYATLRSYRDICSLKQQHFGIQQVLLATHKVMSAYDIEQFSRVVLEGIERLIGQSCSTLYCSSTLPSSRLLHTRRFRVLAASDDIPCHSFDGFDSLPDDVQTAFQQALKSRSSQYLDKGYVGFFASRQEVETLLYVQYPLPTTEFQHQLLDLFATHIATAYENLLLRIDSVATQNELMHIMNKTQTGKQAVDEQYLQRVARITHVLARAYGLPEQDADLLQLAAPLHPIEHYPPVTSVSESTTQLLGLSTRPALQLAAILMQQHQEHWDGSGFPSGLQGNDIHLAARITALAAACAAGLADKNADEVLQELQEKAAKHWDPTLIILLKKHWQEILMLCSEHEALSA